MTPSTRRLLSLLPVAALAACASGPTLRVEDGLAAESIELAVCPGGYPTEIEYHVHPDVVPAAVHAAMDRLHPGGPATSAEKEYEGSTLYWELAKDIGGYKVEAMFTPDGELHSAEVEVPAASVPGAVVAAVDVAAWGPVRAWEEIRDGDRALVEYHAKTTKDGRDYKLLISVDGEVTGAFREMRAEIELPIR